MKFFLLIWMLLCVSAAHGATISPEEAQLIALNAKLQGLINTMNLTSGMGQVFTVDNVYFLLGSLCGMAFISGVKLRL